MGSVGLGGVSQRIIPQNDCDVAVCTWKGKDLPSSLPNNPGALFLWQ